MIKVFLADDEIAIREGVRNSKIWQGGEYVLVGEAPDGEIALSMILDQQPDILITDIRMPFMDGMALAAAVSQRMPWIQIIILSGYDDFNYARQAMSLGVQEYLLKPISSQELLAALNRAAERRQEDWLRSAHREHFSGDSRFLQEKMLSAILSEAAPEDQSIAEQLRALGINLVAGCFVVEDISWQGKGSLTEGRDCIFALSETSRGAIYTCPGAHGTLALILGDHERDAEERAYSFARSVFAAMDRAGLSPVLACIGEAVTSISALPESTHAARHIRHITNASGPLKQSTVVSAKDLTEETQDSGQTEIRPLYELLQYASAEDAESILWKYIASLSGMELRSVMADDYWQTQLILTVIQMLKQMGAGWEDLPELKKYGPILTGRKKGLSTAEGVEMLRAVLQYQDSSAEGHGSRALAKARAYLAQRFDNPNLMLHDVSDFIGMSDSRFSAVFRQKMDMTFTEYLTALRINKAKEYLSATDMRSSEVATAVGYNDPHYFSYLFRKSVGCSPSEYRKQSRPVGNGQNSAE